MVISVHLLVLGVELCSYVGLSLWLFEDQVGRYQYAKLCCSAVVATIIRVAAFNWEVGRLPLRRLLQAASCQSRRQTWYGAGLRFRARTGIKSWIVARDVVGCIVYVASQVYMNG